MLCDPELANVTTMSIRASYATYMLQRYRKGNILANRAKKKFIGYLAKLMNTSEEQLKATYIASDIQDFVTCAEFVADIIDDDKTDDESK